MADLNTFCFTGRLTKHATFKTVSTGKRLLTMDVAINTGYGDYKKTLFVKVNMWGENGAKIADYLTTGTLIATVGELSTNAWQTRDGENRIDLIVDVRGIQILKSKDAASGPVANEGAESPGIDNITF